MKPYKPPEGRGTLLWVLMLLSAILAVFGCLLGDTPLW